jgi:hypothetical protein
MPDLTTSLRPNDRRLMCEPVVNSCGLPIRAAVPPAVACPQPCADAETMLTGLLAIQRDEIVRQSRLILMLRAENAEQAACIRAFRRMTFSNPPTPVYGAIAAAPVVDPIHRAIGAKPHAIGLLTR